jgi:D-glycero-alpha-D-manno-heptose 1-phosphate guanylyltransferase
MLEAIILAGGFGTRLRQIVPDLPKPMAPIRGRPFLEILLSSLATRGFSRIILSLGFMAEKIIEHFGQEFSGIQLVYVIEDTPLGTGGAVRLAMEQGLENHIFVFNGDTYLDLEVTDIEQHWQHQRSAIIVGREVADTARYGRLLVDNGKIRGFAEKGLAGRGLINAGCYVLNNGQLNDFPLYTAFSLETDYFAKIVKDCPLDLFITAGDFIDIGIPADYARAQIELPG